MPSRRIILRPGLQCSDLSELFLCFSFAQGEGSFGVIFEGEKHFFDRISWLARQSRRPYSLQLTRRGASSIGTNLLNSQTVAIKFVSVINATPFQNRDLISNSLCLAGTAEK